MSRGTPAVTGGGGAHACVDRRLNLGTPFSSAWSSPETPLVSPSFALACVWAGKQEACACAGRGRARAPSWVGAHPGRTSAMFLLAQHGEDSAVATAAKTAAARAAMSRKKQLTNRSESHFTPVGGFAGVQQSSPKAARKIRKALRPPNPYINPTYGPRCGIFSSDGKALKDEFGVSVDQKVVFKINACDQFGSRKTIGGDRFVASLRGPAPYIPEITDENNGSYTME